VLALLGFGTLDTAPAATSKSFTGKVEGLGGKVKFQLTGPKVKRFFVSRAYLSCSSSSYSGFRSGGPVPSIRVRGGKFSYDDYPNGDSNPQVTVKGKIRGSKASGTVTVSDGGYDAGAQRTYSCSSVSHSGRLRPDECAGEDTPAQPTKGTQLDLESHTYGRDRPRAARRGQPGTGGQHCLRARR